MQEPRTFKLCNSAQPVALTCDVSRVSPREALEHPGTVGRPRAVKILDADGIEVPAGEAVRPDRYATAGDIGRLDTDGYLYLLDRRDGLIITGGVNVYPTEVEQRLIVHPAVADVAVVGVPDPGWGHRVVAVVELEDGWAGDGRLAAELDAHCRVTLASLKCPDRYEFRESLPRTAAGKLLRRVIRQGMS